MKFLDQERAVTFNFCGLLSDTLCHKTPIILVKCIVLAVILFCAARVTYAEAYFHVGAAKSDITGPFVASSTGYNSPGDEMFGLAMRLYSRTFVISTDENDVAIVTADQLHMYQSVKLGVVKKLAESGYGDIFSARNVLISATHSHAATSNISWYTLFNLFNGVTGFDKLHYQVVVAGIADSIIRAYENRQPATIKYAEGLVSHAAYNRSLLAYQKNIDANLFSADTDNLMRLIRFDTVAGEPIGLINWFAVHGTSLGISNRYIHGDNKGWAAYRFEQTQGDGFVAAFAQGAMGDVSPNIPDPDDRTKPFLRPSDIDAQLDAIENPIVAGKNQYDAAANLYEQANESVNQALDYRHTYVDFNDVDVSNQYILPYKMPWDTEVSVGRAKTCVGVIGAGFLAGDEEGAPVNFAAEGQIKNNYRRLDGEWTQEKYNLNELESGWLADALGALWPVAELALQTKKYDACHKEKFALLPVGEVDDFWFPNPEVPFVPVNIPLQIIRIGQVAVLATPFEMTTMAGRRLQSAVDDTLAMAGMNHLVVSGMANSYGQYLTTREEYAEQHFEGAFTIYGPWAMSTVAQELDKLSQDLVYGLPSQAGPTPPDLSNEQLIETWISTFGVVSDGGKFGRVLTDVNPSYSADKATVSVAFQGAHPRTILALKMAGKLNKYYPSERYSFLEVQKKEQNKWVTVATDENAYTRFDWQRKGGDNSLSDRSTATVTWLVRNQEPGQYRIKYNGLAKRWYFFGTSYKAFSGYSSIFFLAAR